MSNKFKNIYMKITHTSFLMKWSISKILIQIKSRLVKGHTKIYYIGQVIFKDLRYVKIKILNPLYLIASKTNGYFEKISGNKYLTLVPTNESKEIMKNYEELWSKIRDLIR